MGSFGNTGPLTGTKLKTYEVIEACLNELKKPCELERFDEEWNNRSVSGQISKTEALATLSAMINRKRAEHLTKSIKPPVDGS